MKMSGEEGIGEMVTNDVRRLKKALGEAGVKEPHRVRMAAIMLAILGLDKSLEFIAGLPGTATAPDSEPKKAT